jgi:ABC-type proline/glycine betaine transport system permease subunit
MPDFLLHFPFEIPIQLSAVDNGIRSFSIRLAAFFDAIKHILNTTISGINLFLDLLPWWLVIGLVMFGGWKVSGKIGKALLYGALMFAIGLAGLWSKMNETLSIVITSVIVSVLFGFPVGILMAGNNSANRIIRPVLDTMQTMPVFVYLIPAVLFFGLGKAPAVIATTIYAIVPIIRMTSHAIRQVDVEVVEAARAFGSTRLQSLIKVQIPQAMPTIMTGINQTLMMAMAMVVTCSMIGAGGLGMEVLIGVSRIEMGRGLIAGTAVVIVAVLLDRLTQGMGKRGKRH